MKAITLWQPWASAIAVGLKQYETRSWATSYRGPIAIHASKTQPKAVSNACWDLMREVLDTPKMQSFERLPHSCIVATANLVDCISTDQLLSNGGDGEVYREFYWFKTLSLIERRWGDFGPHRFAWKLKDVKIVKPVPFKGKQGMWELPDDTHFEVVEGK